MNTIDQIKRKLIAWRGVLKGYQSMFYTNMSYRKFVIVANARTGSNLLVSLLNSHPNIDAQGEIFSTLDGYQSQDIWNRTFGAKPKQTLAAGFKLFYFHPQDDQGAEVWTTIESDPTILIIHLKRQHLLRAYLSALIAAKTNQWKKTSGQRTSLADKKVRIKPEQMLAEFRKIQKWEEETEQRFAQHQIVTIYYADLVRHRQETAQQIFSVLGLTAHQVSSRYQKQNPESLEKLIDNYAEIKRVLQETNQQSFLESEFA